VEWAEGFAAPPGVVGRAGGRKRLLGQQFHYRMNGRFDCRDATQMRFHEFDGGYRALANRSCLLHC